MENILDEETTKELKMQRITDLIEQVLTDTALAVLYRLADNRKLRPPVICYKDHCPMRDNIPF
ncbi:MAG: hypothetical protein EOM08_15455 [Clostridia bacterium]|nr:hypothetical protein [Clostridia bacterium]